jgi:hypothetical protein
MIYGVTCSCGDVMKVKAGNREEAVRNMKALMNEERVYEHMAQKHLRDRVPSMQHIHAVIEQNLKSIA